MFGDDTFGDGGTFLPWRMLWLLILMRGTRSALESSHPCCRQVVLGFLQRRRSLVVGRRLFTLLLLQAGDECLKDASPLLLGVITVRKEAERAACSLNLEHVNPLVVGLFALQQRVRYRTAIEVASVVLSVDYLRDVLQG